MPQIATLLKTMQLSQKNSFQPKSSHCGKSGAKWPKNKKTVCRVEKGKAKTRSKEAYASVGNVLSGNLQSPKKGALRECRTISLRVRSTSELRILFLRWSAMLSDEMVLPIQNKGSYHAPTRV